MKFLTILLQKQKKARKNFGRKKQSEEEESLLINSEETVNVESTEDIEKKARSVQASATRWRNIMTGIIISLLTTIQVLK